jgi:hypothetical protein
LQLQHHPQLFAFPANTWLMKNGLSLGAGRPIPPTPANRTPEARWPNAGGLNAAIVEAGKAAMR